MHRTAGVSATTCANRLQRDLIPLLPWAEWGLCAILAGLLLWKGILPGWRVLHTDFPNYYLVARLLREGYALDRIYDWVWLQRIKDHWGLTQPLVGFAGLTPFSALPVVPFSFLPALAAKRLWIIANIFLLASSVEGLHRVTHLGRRRLWLLALLAVFPLRTSFLLGQMHLLVLSLIVLAYFFHRNNKQVACAICLSIAGSLKVYPLLFGFYFLWKRQWRSAAAMACSVLFILGIGYAAIGRMPMNIYLTQVLPRSMQGEVLDPYSMHAASAAALLHRLFIFEPTLNPTPWLPSPSLYAVAYPLWQLTILLPLLALLQENTSSPETEQMEWAAFSFALLVLSPVPASYHFVVMVFSLVLLVDLLLVRRRDAMVALAVTLYGAISLIEFFPLNKNDASGQFLACGRLWIELCLLAVFLYCLWQNRSNYKVMRASTVRIASLCSVVVALWTVGAIGYHQHFLYLEKDTAARMLPEAPVYLATGVRRTLDGYLFTAMTGEGYRVLDQNGRALWNSAPAPFPTDQLSVATARAAPGVLIELADKTGSRLVLASAGLSARDIVSDAEYPALSSAGTSAAFIRERKGRGTLWFVRIHQPPGASQSEPIPLTGDAYDVRNVTFANAGWILFSASNNGHIGIFRLIPGNQPRVFLADRDDVDSPAVSADDRLVAFTKLVHDRWQLGYENVATGHETILTYGDCSAYSPAWISPTTIAYATDCGRGLGLSALASIDIALQVNE